MDKGAGYLRPREKLGPNLGFHYTACLTLRALPNHFRYGPGKSCQWPWVHPGGCFGRFRLAWTLGKLDCMCQNRWCREDLAAQRLQTWRDMKEVIKRHIRRYITYVLMDCFALERIHKNTCSIATFSRWRWSSWRWHNICVKQMAIVKWLYLLNKLNLLSLLTTPFKYITTAKKYSKYSEFTKS